MAFGECLFNFRLADIPSVVVNTKLVLGNSMRTVVDDDFVHFSFSVKKFSFFGRIQTEQKMKIRNYFGAKSSDPVISKFMLYRSITYHS